MAVKKRIVRQKAKGPIDPALGHRIRALRDRSGMTQAELAGSDFSKGFISLLETGRTRVSLRAAHILADRLGVPVTELIGEPMAPAEHLTKRLRHARDVLSEMSQYAERMHAAASEAEEYVKSARPIIERAIRQYESLMSALEDLPQPTRTR